MGKAYKCPLCGYTARSKQSVISHILSTSDDLHGPKGSMGAPASEIIEVEVEGEDEQEGVKKKPENLESLYSELQSLKSEVQSLKEQILVLSRKSEVHKEAIVKILEFLGVKDD